MIAAGEVSIVGQCEHWWQDGESGWCDLMSGACNCAARDENCSLSDNAVSSALLEEERATLQEASLRARKRRSTQMAS